MTRILNRERLRTMPDAVLFDTDNTLYPYDPAHAAAMAAVRRKVTSTLSITGEQFERAYESARQEIKRRLHDTASSHSRLLYFQHMIESLGLGSQVLLALDFEQTYWRTFLSNARLFDGVREFLDELRLDGVPVAIVTDLTAQIQFRKVVYLGLDHYFDYIVTSEEAGLDKPHDAPFLLAVEKLRPKGDCVWMIGDNPKNDIDGARRAINAVTFQKYHKGVVLGKGHGAPDVVFKDFRTLTDLLLELRSDYARAEPAGQH